jgi:RNA polymerase sigma factor (sigma-70 family)
MRRRAMLHRLRLPTPYSHGAWNKCSAAPVLQAKENNRVIPPNAEPSRRERFEATVLSHLGAAYNLARWLLRDDAAAEDAVQDASLRAFRFFDALQGPTPKAWFMAIVRNACMDRLGQRQRRGIEESFDETEHGAALNAGQGNPSPEALAMQADDLRQLHAGLAALSCDFREVLILREMEELSYREISAVVGVPIGTVMSRLSRGREQLARLLKAPVRRQSS